MQFSHLHVGRHCRVTVPLPGYWVAGREPVAKNPGRSRGPQGDHNPRVCSLEGVSDFLCVLNAGCDPTSLGVDSEITAAGDFPGVFRTADPCALCGSDAWAADPSTGLSQVRALLQAPPCPGPSGTSRASQAASASDAAAFV